MRRCLHLAASEGNMAVVGALLELRADVNFKDRWGGTPIRDAVRHGHMVRPSHVPLPFSFEARTPEAV